MAGKKVFVKSETTSFVNDDTGEITLIETKKLHKIQTKSEDRFFQVYYETLASFYDLRYTDDLKLLIRLAQLAEWNTGKVLLPASIREEICTHLTIHTTNLSKSLKRLKEKDLIQGERGVFVINPNVFWKGDKEMREKQLKEDGLYFTIKFQL
jgi:hypothetical protein